MKISSRTINFEKVEITVKKRGKCVCGKTLVRQKTFWQTINPFNKNEKGKICTEREVYEKVEKEANKWKNSHVYHNIPSYWKWDIEKRKDYDAGKKIKLVMECGKEIEIDKNLKSIIW